MAIAKKKRELELKRKQRQLEMGAMQDATELANLRDQICLKMQEMKLQIQEAEGFCPGSTISPCLISLPFDEEKEQ